MSDIVIKIQSCGDCHQRKEVNDYYKDKSKASVYRRICKKCDSKRRKDYYVRSKKATKVSKKTLNNKR